MVSRTIEGAQTRVEGYNFDMRKHVVEYDDVINRQRETIYRERERILRSKDLGRRRSWPCSTRRCAASSPSTPRTTATASGTARALQRAACRPWSRR